MGVSKKAERKGRSEVQKTAKALTHLKVEYVSVDAVRPNTYNPNRQAPHEFEMLKRSMKEDGFTTPIIVQKDTKEIVDGEHRWRVAKAIGYKQIPVVYVAMSIAQMRISTLRHNRARGQENVELTAELLRELEQLGALDWAQHALEMDDIEIQRLIEDVSAPEALGISEEYSQPWMPVPGANVKANSISMSVQAADRLRVLAKKIKAAKTQQDRDAARADAKVYRINLIFTDEEAEPVKAILGNEPARKILNFCKAEYSALQKTIA